jgi:hypothetical protein
MCTAFQANVPHLFEAGPSLPVVYVFGALRQDQRLWASFAPSATAEETSELNPTSVTCGKE